MSNDEINEAEPISPHRGLSNMGATCYLNGLIQTWFHIKQFRDASFALLKFTIDPIPVNVARVFAYLMRTRRSFVDPVMLVDALALDHRVQQDAQEFGRLFLTKFDSFLSRFNCNIVKELFQGSQTYITKCSKCCKESPRNENFYELELAVTKSLEESLELYLKHGTLSGDNQYYCQYCGFRTDATRFIHIKKLPVYLNIQLLRFIYNPKTESLKKIKSNFKFPLIADFKQHVHSNSDCRYELYAILNHHGQNATSGHYIVDIKIDGKWSRFDDDSVSVLENVEGASSTAYILVYKLASMNYISDNEIPGVFVNEINEDNNLFKIQDDELQAKLKVDLELKNQVKEIVNLVVDLNSNIQDNDDCFLVSSESFKPWTALKILDKNHVFKNEKIECKHGNVDGNSKYMRVSTESYELLKNFGLDFDPVFDSKSICLECREFSDQGDLFYQKHSKFVNALKKAIDLDDDGLSFYISKAWYNDLKKNKKPTCVQDDGISYIPPDTGRYYSDVRCKHGNLQPKLDGNYRIFSFSALKPICEMFPAYDPIFTETAECQECNPHSNALKQSATIEKTNLKRLHLKKPLDFSHEVEYKVVTVSFLEEWRAWLKSPSNSLLPSKMDTSKLICKHSCFIAAPLQDLENEDGDFALVTFEEYDFIAEKYQIAGPNITITAIFSDQLCKFMFQSNPEMCSECWRNHCRDFESCYIYVQLNQDDVQQDETLKRKRRSGASKKTRPYCVLVSKSDTVKDIKVSICRESGISPISQKLFLNGLELIDNEITVEALGLEKDQTLNLTEIVEEDFDFNSTAAGFGQSNLTGY